MLLKINGTEIAVYPESKDFVVTFLDLDNAESSVRGTDGSLNRDRIAVKRQIDIAYGMLEWSKISALLQSMSGTSFTFYYPDPMDGVYATRTFYVNNRPASFPIESGGKMFWMGLKFSLIEI